jgi:tetratricopeptide (TPR) repeat protein
VKERRRRIGAPRFFASPRSALAHFAKGQVLRMRGRYAEAIHEYETVLALDRNRVGALAAIGRCKIFLGLLEEAILTQEQSIRLSPRDSATWNWYFRIGQAYLLQSRIDQAIPWLAQSLWAATLVGRILDFRSCAAQGDVGRAEQMAARAVAATRTPRTSRAREPIGTGNKAPR